MQAPAAWGPLLQLCSHDSSSSLPAAGQELILGTAAAAARLCSLTLRPEACLHTGPCIAVEVAPYSGGDDNIVEALRKVCALNWPHAQPKSSRRVPSACVP